MTTLKEGREIMLETLRADHSDFSLQKEMIEQLFGITLGDNPYYVSRRLPPDEMSRFGSVEYHPDGFELCVKQWLETGAASQWRMKYRQCV